MVVEISGCSAYGPTILPAKRACLYIQVEPSFLEVSCSSIFTALHSATELATENRPVVLASGIATQHSPHRGRDPSYSIQPEVWGIGTFNEIIQSQYHGAQCDIWNSSIKFRVLEGYME